MQTPMRFHSRSLCSAPPWITSRARTCRRSIRLNHLRSKSAGGMAQPLLLSSSAALTRARLSRQ
jgi:hypothetical protein